MSQPFAARVQGSFGKEQVVNSLTELLQAVADPAVKMITVAQDLAGVPEIRLSPSTTLRGRPGHRSVLQFAEGVQGLCLSSDNFVANLDLLVSPERLAIWNDDSVSSLRTPMIADL
jgi:hypothetical protein